MTVKRISMAVGPLLTSDESCILLTEGRLSRRPAGRAAGSCIKQLMLLREISVRTRYKAKAHFEGLGVVQIITELYLSCIKKYDSGEFCKIVIEIEEQVEGNGIDRMLNVIAVKKEIRFSEISAIKHI